MAHPNPPGRTEEVEMYVGISHGGDCGTWHTTHVDVPAGLDDDAKAAAANAALDKTLTDADDAATGDVAFFGVYCLNAAGEPVDQQEPAPATSATDLNAEAWQLVDDVALGNTEYDRLSEIAGDLLERARAADKTAAAELTSALNRAADDVLEAIDAPDEGVRDAINLVINAAAHYARHPGADLAAAITANYQEDPETVLDWARRSVR